jgi:hypothetical protein
MKYLYLFLAFVLLNSGRLYSQKKGAAKPDTTKINGDYVRGNKTVYNINKVYKNGPPKSSFIKLDKFLDTSKMIHVFEGSGDSA